MTLFPNRKKILIIEDEASVREILKEFLSDFGFEIHEAENGSVGYFKYKKVEYDLLIIDITMPKISGADLVRNIRTVDKNIKILMLTSCAEKDVIKDLVILGIQGWILKPFEEEAFKEKVLKILE